MEILRKFRRDPTLILLFLEYAPESQSPTPTCWCNFYKCCLRRVANEMGIVVNRSLVCTYLPTSKSDFNWNDFRISQTHSVILSPSRASSIIISFGSSETSDRTDDDAGKTQPLKNDDEKKQKFFFTDFNWTSLKAYPCEDYFACTFTCKTDTRMVLVVSLRHTKSARRWVLDWIGCTRRRSMVVR